MNPSLLPLKKIAATACVAVLATSASNAATATWNLGDTGGNWSTAGNWNPAAAPVSGDTAILNDVTTGTRTVVYDAAATGALGTLNVNQATAGAINVLEIQRSLNVTNNISLGASAGTERIYLNPTAGAFTLTNSNITLNSGGQLYAAAYRVSSSSTTYSATVSGTITIAGGSLTIQPSLNNSGGNTATSANGLVVSNGITMTSGSIYIDNSSGITGTRIDISNIFNLTGGTVSAAAAGAQLNIWSGTNTMNVTSFDYTKISLQLGNAATLSTFTTNQTLGSVLIRGNGAVLYGNKQITSTAAGNGIGAITLIDSDNTLADSASALKLGSNLTVNAGAAGPAAAGFSDAVQSGQVNYAIDLNGYTLDVSAGANSGKWTPNKSTTAGVTNTIWEVKGTTGSVLKAGSFNFNTSGVTSNIRSGVVLTATGANSTANDLGGTGTIDAGSTFRYSGTATSANPATLTSNRAIGKLEVTSGALRLTSANAIQGATTISGGTLILGSSASLGGTPSVTLGSTGVLNTSAQSSFAMLSAQPFTFTLDAAGVGAAGKIVAAGLDITNSTVNFTSVGTLDDGAYIIASYTSLTGTTFASVTGLQAGYTIDYNYNGLNQIAVIPEPSVWALALGGILVTTIFRRRKQAA